MLCHCKQLFVAGFVVGWGLILDQAQMVRIVITSQEASRKALLSISGSNPAFVTISISALSDQLSASLHYMANLSAVN
jgi:hypothetical protein